MRIKRRRVAYTFTLPAQVNIDIDVGSEARKLKKNMHCKIDRKRLH